MPMRETKEQLARIGRLPKLVERVKKLEQLLGEWQKSLPPDSERLSG
jgi:hypothetical protein